MESLYVRMTFFFIVSDSGKDKMFTAYNFLSVQFVLFSLLHGNGLFILINWHISIGFCLFAIAVIADVYSIKSVQVCSICCCNSKMKFKCEQITTIANN